MKTVQQVYDEYRIMPSLQLHQLRVAAVAKVICSNLTTAVDADSVVLAGLFHDMGNIIKSDLEYFPAFVQPEGVEYWQKVKDEYLQKYGTNHHAAIVAIAEEIGLSPRVIELVGGIGYSNLEKIVASSDWDLKIVEYSDTRVGPEGVLPLKERLLEGRKRYLQTAQSRPHYDTNDGFEKLAMSATLLEKQVTEHANISPEDISDNTIGQSLEELRNYAVA